MRHVAVIDYGMGNLRSVSKALEAVAEEVTVKVTADPEQILSASHIVFPGVGAIRDCVADLSRLGLDEVIREAAQTKPFLGICLGMQALLTHSEENNGTAALNIIPGEVRQFDTTLSRSERDFKVPHMGRTIDFKNTVIIMTSNLGSDVVQLLAGDDNYDLMKSSVMDVVSGHFRPEFINRVDEVVVFHPLSKDQLRGIANIQLALLAKRLAELDLTLRVDDAVLDRLLEAGFLQLIAKLFRSNPSTDYASSAHQITQLLVFGYHKIISAVTKMKPPNPSP